MLKLPKIPYTMDKEKQQVVSMGDINYSKMTKDGDVADSSGISGRHFPYITTAKECAREDLGANIVSATFFRGKWATVDSEGKLYYDDKEVGQLADGEKQFAAINTKLVIMPDKKYLDVSERVELKDLGAEISSSTYKKTDNSISLMPSAKFVGNISKSDSNNLSISPRVTNTFKENGMVAVEKRSDAWGLTFIEYFISPFTVKFLEDSAQHFEVSNSWVPVEAFEYKLPMIVYIEERNSEQGQWNYITDISCISDGVVGVTLGKPCIFYSSSQLEQSLFIYKLDTDYNCPDGDEGYIRLTSEQKDLYLSVDSVVNRKKLGDLDVSEMKFNTIVVKNDAFDGSLLSPRVMNVDCLDDGGIVGDLKDIDNLEDGCNILLSFELDSQIYEIVGKAEALDDWSTRIGTLGVLIENMSPDISTLPDEELSAIVTLTPLPIGMPNIIKAGDVVKMSWTTALGTTRETNFRVASVNADNYTLLASSDVFRDITLSGDIKIERCIPILDYICTHNNRLYGCSNDDQTIYVSALGDPTNIYAYEGVATDSYAVAVASEGDFTGCCPYDGGVMFWKEQKLHKLLGSYPAEYALYTYNIDGVQEGSHKSLQNIGEVLYYKGERGIFAFDGSPRLISENFGEKRFKEAVAGNDGDCYYISMKDKDGKQHFFSYNTRTDLWVREGDMAIGEFIRTSDGVHMLKDGEIYLYGAKETAADSEWFIQLAPIYESIEGKKSYSRIKMRIELPKGSYITVAVRCDGGRWAECGKIVGRVAGVVPVMIPINRCDRFELKISGKGPCTIHSILREYYVGGDR